MLPAVVNAQNCWLLPFHPGGEPSRLKVSIPLDIRRSLTGRSARRPFAITPRYETSWKSVMTLAEFTALRTAALAAQDEPILAPIWAHAYAPGDAPTITAGIVVAFKNDWSAWAINPADVSIYDTVAPVLYGRFIQPPRLAAVAGNLIVAEFSVEEDAPVELSFAPVAGILPADTTFGTVSAYAAPVFPFAPSWSRTPQPSVAITEVSRDEIGPGRIKATTFYPQQPERVLAASFTAFGATEAAQLIAWWIRRGGESDSHWVADTMAPWGLAEASGAGSNILHFTETDIPMPAVGSTLALTNGTAVEIVRVNEVVGRAATLTTNLVREWDANTRVSDAILARHTNRELSLDYVGLTCELSLSWREVAPENNPPEGEQRGVTLGRLPGAAYFFTIDLDFNGAVRTWNLTNFESGAYVNLTNWTYNACDFDRLVQSIDLEDDNCQMTFRYFAGGPWDNWGEGGMSARGFVTIYRADVSTAGAFSDFRQIWKGELARASIDGAIVKQPAKGANTLFSKRGPRQVMSKLCGTMLFRARCGLALADWTFSALITDVTGNTITVGTITRDNADPLPDGFGAENWFALGWLQWLSAGAPMRHAILGSAEIGGGQIALTLDRTVPIGAGSSVKLVPGCDRTATTCREKFANYDRFRGFELMPAVSPSFILPQRQIQAGKK